MGRRTLLPDNGTKLKAEDKISEDKVFRGTAIKILDFSLRRRAGFVQQPCGKRLSNTGLIFKMNFKNEFTLLPKFELVRFQMLAVAFLYLVAGDYQVLSRPLNY